LKVNLILERCYISRRYPPTHGLQ